jgi:hypothetical protein
MICARTRVSRICFDVSAYPNSAGQNCLRNREAASQSVSCDAGGIHMPLWRRCGRADRSRVTAQGRLLRLNSWIVNNPEITILPALTSG